MLSCCCAVIFYLIGTHDEEKEEEGKDGVCKENKNPTNDVGKKYWGLLG